MQKNWLSFHKKIKNFIHSHVANKADAEDITQDICLKIHQKIDDLKDQDKLESWIFAIARNSILSHYRRHKNNPLNHIVDYELQNITQQVDQKHAFFELACCLKTFIYNLPPNAQHAILATSYGGQSQKHFAKMHNIPLSTVKSRVQRARKQLAKAFKKCCKYENNEIIQNQACCKFLNASFSKICVSIM